MPFTNFYLKYGDFYCIQRQTYTIFVYFFVEFFSPKCFVVYFTYILFFLNYFYIYFTINPIFFSIVI